MAHEVEVINGVAQMAYVGQKPWHGLGVQVADDLTPEQIMIAAGLDWSVEKIPAMIDYNGQMIPTGWEALVRDSDGSILTQVGEGWNPVQNSEAFEFFNDFIDAGDMKMDTAGSLKDGRIVWALAKINDSFELFDGDKVEGYLLFSNPHQYGQSINIRFTPIRVVCNNTLTLSLKTASASNAKISHRKMFDAEEVKKTLGIATAKMSTYKAIANQLGTAKVTEDVMTKYFGDVFGESKKADEVLKPTGKRALELVSTQPGAEYAPGTMWQAFNAVTYLVDHEIGRTADSRIASAWYGAGQRLKNQALKTAIEYAKAA